MEQAFAAKEDESDFLKRIKNSPRKIIEGGGVIGIIAERSFQALGMAYRVLRNSPRFKQGQKQSIGDFLAEPRASPRYKHHNPAKQSDVRASPRP